MENRTFAKTLIKVCLVLTAFSIFGVSCFQKGERIQPVITSSETPEPPAVRTSQKTFENFSHQIPEHQKFACDSCHQRESGPLKVSMELKYAGHDSCIGCHLNQFTSQEPKMCAICHDNMNSSPPTIDAFPAKFREGFNMKFDHAVHSRGDAEPSDGCVACHSPAGAAKSIPIGINAHADCMSCHTPESKIGSCSVCHELAPYNRTPQSRYAFRAVFSHADHSAAQGVSCNECHDVIARAPQSRQVTLPLVHGHRKAEGNRTSCYNCHNNVRAFGDADFANCKRCHTGSGFDMLPN